MSNWKSRDRKVGKRRAFTFKAHKKSTPSQKKARTSVGKRV